MRSYDEIIIFQKLSFLLQNFFFSCILLNRFCCSFCGSLFYMVGFYNFFFINMELKKNNTNVSHKKILILKMCVLLKSLRRKKSCKHLSLSMLFFAFFCHSSYFFNKCFLNYVTLTIKKRILRIKLAKIIPQRNIVFCKVSLSLLPGYCVNLRN